MSRSLYIVRPKYRVRVFEKASTTQAKIENARARRDAKAERRQKGQVQNDG